MPVPDLRAVLEARGVRSGVVVQCVRGLHHDVGLRGAPVRHRQVLQAPVGLILQGCIRGVAAIAELRREHVGLRGRAEAAGEVRTDPGEVGLGIARRVELAGVRHGDFPIEERRAHHVPAARVHAADRIVRPLARRVELRRASVGRRVPLVAVVLQVGQNAAQVEVRRIIQLVVGAATKSFAGAVVAILTDGIVVVERRRERRKCRVDGRLDVVDAAAVVVVAGAHEEAELLGGSESFAEGEIELIVATAAENVVARPASRR